jgi:hypothetical protein
MTLPKFPEVDSWTVSAPPTTCTVSATAPVSSTAFTVFGSPMRTTLPVDSNVLKPGSSTLTV